MTIVDSHVHVWTLDTKRYPFQPTLPDVPPPTEPATAEMLIEEMDRAGVQQVVLVQPSTYGWDNRYLADCIASYPHRFAGVCLVNPLDPEAPKHLGRWVREHGCHGVRLHAVRADSPQWFTGSQITNVWRVADHLGIPICILMELEHAPLVETMVRRFPGVKVVIDHMGRLQVDEPPPYPNFQGLLRLAAYPNTYAKVSGLLHYSRQGYPFHDTHPFFKLAREAWGAERLMWGTDWPMQREVAGYQLRLEAVRKEMTFFTPAELEWVLGKTALRLWQFRQAPSPRQG